VKEGLTLRTVIWEQNQVLIIDQRKLPLTLEYRRCGHYRQVVLAIRDMLVRGAPAIGATAAYGMALAAVQLCYLERPDFLSRIEEVSGEFAATRPTAVNLFWALREIGQVIDNNRGRQPREISGEILKTAEKIAGDDINTNRKIGRYGNELVPPVASILTHCNTGSLATVEFGTALGVIRTAHGQGKKVHVFVDETRPRLQVWENIILIQFKFVADTVFCIKKPHLPCIYRNSEVGLLRGLPSEQVNNRRNCLLLIWKIGIKL